MTAEYKTAVPVPIEQLTPYEKNAKQHDDRQIENIAESIRRFGFTQPLVIDKDGVVIIGHGRLAAAKKIGLQEVPCIQRDDLTEKEIRQLRILDNKLNESPWDAELLANDLDAVSLEGFDLSVQIDEPEENNRVADIFLIVPFSIIRQNNSEMETRREIWNRICGGLNVL